MLKFDPFVSFLGQMDSAKAKAARTNEYRRYVKETLAKFQVEDVHDLDDESYGKFLEELKGFRKGRLVAEGVLVDGAGETAETNPELERFRGSCLEDLSRHSQRIRHIVSELVDTPFTCYVAGPVNSSSFRADSPVEIAVLTEDSGRPAGEIADLTRMLQRRLMFGFTFGPLSASVRNMQQPGDGWTRL